MHLSTLTALIGKAAWLLWSRLGMSRRSLVPTDPGASNAHIVMKMEVLLVSTVADTVWLLVGYSITPCALLDYAYHRRH